VFIIIIVSGISFITITELWPDIFHSILSINKSRSQRLQILFTTEYFIDEEKYFYLLLLYQNLTFCIGLFGVLATGSMLIAYLQHACGMFQLAR